MPSDADVILSLLFTIGRHMRDGEHAMKRRGKQAFSMLHFHTLRYIKERKRPFMRDVADHLCVTPPAATLLVEGLVKEGLVRRVVDKKDRRAIRLVLTREGDAFLARGIRTRIKQLTRLFSALTGAERGAFIGILRKIASATERR